MPGTPVLFHADGSEADGGPAGAGSNGPVFRRTIGSSSQNSSGSS